MFLAFLSQIYPGHCQGWLPQVVVLCLLRRSLVVCCSLVREARRHHVRSSDIGVWGGPILIPGSSSRLVVNPAAAPTAPGTAPAAPESTDAAEAVGAANAGILGDSNGAFASVQLSASTLVLSAVAAVAALAL